MNERNMVITEASSGFVYATTRLDRILSLLHAEQMTRADLALRLRNIADEMEGTA